MIGRLLGIVFAVVAGVSAASAQSYLNVVPFKRILAEDVGPEHYRVAEDSAVSERMRARKPVTAMFQILASYRSKDFGSGVSFWILSADRTKGARIIFRDVEGQDTLQLHVTRTSSEGQIFVDYIPRESLLSSKTRVGEVTIMANAERHLSISVEGRTRDLQLDFVPDQLVAQIFCSHSWIAFSDSDLIA